MKTAMQEIIEKMNEAKECFPSIGFDDEFLRGFNKGFQMAAFITIQVGIPKEKMQIIDAWDSGYETDWRPNFSAEDYYDKTFKKETI